MRIKARARKKFSCLLNGYAVSWNYTVSQYIVITMLCYNNHVSFRMLVASFTMWLFFSVLTTDQLYHLSDDGRRFHTSAVN